MTLSARFTRTTMLCALAAIAGLASLCATAFGDGGSDVSAIVYPARPQGLIMNHRTPAHRALACVHCHESSANAAATEGTLVPREAVCTECHAAATDRAQQGAKTCGMCHRGFDPGRSSALAPVRGQPARLRFSHGRHARAEIACTTCHGQLVDSLPAADGGKPSLVSPTMPSMGDCLACHRGQKTLPCKGCHIALPSGLLRTRFPEGALVPRSSFLGMAHDRDFSVRHRWLAADDSAACSSCHVEKDCTACHDGDRRPRGLHPNDYLTLHAQDAERSASRCTSCHTTQSFCMPCHARLGVSPVAAPDLASPKRFHPPSAVWVRGPMQHAREAQRSLATCASCHAERDCVTCHGAPGIGAGVSPHPPGFAAECAARMQASSRACATCHRDIENLRARCR